MVDSGDPGMGGGGDITVDASSPITVAENIVGTNITLTANDSAGTGDDLTVLSGYTIESAVYDFNAQTWVTSNGTIILNAGDDFILEAGATIRTNGTVKIYGDFGNTDTGVGSNITINGTIDANLIQIYGNTDDDVVLFDAQGGNMLTGKIEVFGDDGDDLITVNELHDRTEEMDLDGQGDTDRYIINTTGNSDYIINVWDTGAPDDGADRLTINGTDGDDTFLIRRNFVASLQETGLEDPQFEDTLERINYNENINARLRVNGLEGADSFYSDDNSSITTLDGGSGEDYFQIGQMFGLDRVAPQVAAGDEITTVETTVGFLSRGISFPTTVYGGDDADNFIVYSNKALLKLFGEDGNDEFVVRAFVLKDTGGLASTDTEVNGGAGDDHIQYNINAPVSIDGGAGADTVVVLGTEIADNFVITEDGVEGAGLNIDFTAVEKLEVDGLEGDDHFFILSTSPDLQTTIIGGLGSDTFDVAGDVTETIVALDVEGRTGYINHSLTSDDPAYNGIFAEGIQLHVADAETGAVMIQEIGDTVVVENDNDGTIQIDEEDTYKMKMAIPAPTEPTEQQKVYVTVSAALSPYKDELIGGKALEISVDGSAFAPAVVVTFDPTVAGTTDPTAWAKEHEFRVRGVYDTAEEGEHTVVISHSSFSDNTAFDNLNIPNVEVKLIDDDKAGLIITETDQKTQVLEGNATGDTYEISLTKAPDSGETVTVTLDMDVIGDAQLSLADPSSSGRFTATTGKLTFDDTNWSTPFTIKVTADDDATPENRLRARITHTISSTGGTDPQFDNVPEDFEVKVDIRDDDAAGIIVTETNGSTLVSEGNPDFYDIVLTKAPTHDVVVSILTDGQTIVSTDSDPYSRFDDSGEIPTVTFTPGNWNNPFTVRVDENPVADGNPTVQVFPAQPHSTANIMGPLTIEGSVIPGKDRSLKEAVMLPSETDGPLPVLEIEVDETQQTDTLNVFNAGSVFNDTGTHDYAQNADGLAMVYEVETSEIVPILTEFGNISGLNMGGEWTLDFGTPGEPDERTFDGGITYHGVEVVDILLGQGNDQFTVENTLEDVITVVQGGGNNPGVPLVTSEFGSIVGDHIIVNGGGGADSPLIVFGDTSQDGQFYNSTTFAITGNGREFPNPGNDIIDARLATQSIAIYGGRGDDTIYGSQTGDHIAGGSGNDTIYGQAGVDHIYGDSGFNIDISTRLSLVDDVDGFQILTVVTAPDSGDYELTRDALVAGDDTISGEGDEDIIFGDHGVVELTPGTEKILTTAEVERVFTIEPSNGADDTIHGNDGVDRILGGNGSDTITGDDGDDIIIGDNGWIDYNTGDDDLLTVDLVQTTDHNIGSDDTIEGNAGSDFILGGQGGDMLYGDAATPGVADGIDYIIGDNGEVIFAGGMVAQVRTTDTLETTGGADTIHGNDGGDLILGGVNGSPDVIMGDAGDDIILGDNGEFIWDAAADPNLATLDLVYTTDVHLGDSDEVYGNSGDDLIFGGTGGDTISGNENDDVVFGDFARATLSNNIVMEITVIDNAEGGADTIYGNADEDVLVGGAAGDFIDGNEADDLIFGDNVVLDRLNIDDFTNPRFRTLTGTSIYGEVPGLNDGDPLVDGTPRNIPTLTGTPVWGDWDINFLNHTADEIAGQNNFGDDYIAGGADDDTIFGQLGDDIIQGDGSIGEAVSAERLSEGTLNVNPSVESTSDGDDYIEGNGGDDVIFGNLGQDDIIGDNSSLFSLDTYEEREPSGADLIFGGAGTDISRNNLGDAALNSAGDAIVTEPTGHARDADMILGDNGNIYRLVSVSGACQQLPEFQL